MSEQDDFDVWFGFAVAMLKTFGVKEGVALYFFRAQGRETEGLLQSIGVAPRGANSALAHEVFRRAFNFEASHRSGGASLEMYCENSSGNTGNYCALAIEKGRLGEEQIRLIIKILLTAMGQRLDLQVSKSMAGQSYQSQWLIKTSEPARLIELFPEINFLDDRGIYSAMISLGGIFIRLVVRA